VESYRKLGYLKKIDDVMIRDLFEAIREKGFEPSEFGLTEDMVRRRLSPTAGPDRGTMESAGQAQKRDCSQAPPPVRVAIYRFVDGKIVDDWGIQHFSAPTDNQHG
jgi:hypothetical protein